VDLIDGDFERASERVERIAELTQNLRYEAAEFARIVECIESYRQESVSDIESVLETISGLPGTRWRTTSA
jgi:predicted translin family RNA/ssDNA-binding protein